jgi:GTP cyclohydrolase I
MSLRGVHKPNVATVTSHYLGEFKTDQMLQSRFLALAGAMREVI